MDCRTKSIPLAKEEKWKTNHKGEINMFELFIDEKGRRYLKWVARNRRPGERGIWVEIGGMRDRGIKEIIAVNRSARHQVEVDEHGAYRALVLSE